MKERKPASINKIAAMAKEMVHHIKKPSQEDKIECSDDRWEGLHVALIVKRWSMSRRKVRERVIERGEREAD